MLLQSCYWPGRLQPCRMCWCVAGLSKQLHTGVEQEEKLRSEPNFKVMEDSQAQHEGMNFRQVLLCFQKLKP